MTRLLVLFGYKFKSKSLFCWISLQCLASSLDIWLGSILLSIFWSTKV